MARLMVDDDEAAKRWIAAFEEHVTAVALEMGVRRPSWRLSLPDTPTIRAMAQAYHEGIEGLRTRGH